MVAAATRKDPDALRWGRITRSYVGVGKRLSVSRFEEAIRGVQRTGGLEATAVRARVYDRLAKAKIAQPEAAWEEGEALRCEVPWASGLLGLLASGHYADATGIIGLSKAPLSCERLLAMIDGVDAACYSSRFDAAIDPDLDVVITPWHLKSFIETRVVTPLDADGKPIVGDKALNDFTLIERELLEKRRAAREIWTLNEQVRLAFTDARTAWLRRKRSPQGLSGYLNQAVFSARNSALSPDDRKMLWRDAMLLWLFSHLPGDHSGSISIIRLHALLANPHSTLTHEFTEVLKFGARGKDDIGRLARRALRDLEAVQLNGAALLSILSGNKSNTSA